MTKADFLAGKPFKFGYSEYKYNEGPNDIVTINGGFVFKGKFVGSGRVFTFGKKQGIIHYTIELLENGKHVATAKYEDYYKD